MCRNIKTLHNFAPPATDGEIRASALQFVRKLSGFAHPSKANEAAFERAIDRVSDAAHELLDALVSSSPARNRETEAAKARERSKQRFARGLVVVAALAAAGVSARAAATGSAIIVPNGWAIARPAGLMTETDTMPQGAAASSDGKTLAVVESGFNPPTLRLYSIADLAQLAHIPLPGAFGRPVWIDAQHVLIAGANADALLKVDVRSQSVETIALGKHSYPTAVAASDSGLLAVATDGDGSVRIGPIATIASAKPLRVGPHVGAVTFSPDGTTAFAANVAGSDVAAIDTRTLAARTIPTGLHPSDVLASGNGIYVAESDGDTVGHYDAATGRRLASIYVGNPSGRRLDGTSPNALARQGETLFVSLGAANSIAVVRGDRVAGRVPAGWYPTDVVPLGHRLYIVDGKGEGAHPNPNFPARHLHNYYDYVAAIEYGSIRTYDLSQHAPLNGNPQGSLGWSVPPSDSVVHAGGPIKHVFFILKENRSYDQVLGDVKAGNGDAKLTWFGARVTPNQHALAARFGLFDNMYASGEVSESGHNWADAAFVNDYVERNWPVTYGDRGNVDDSLSGSGAAVARNGFIWQEARASHVSFRDYGELTNVPNLTGPGESSAPSLAGLYDPHYVGWNLDYSDLDRVREWRREFDAFVRSGDVPQLEYVWLPNDHTYGSRAGKLTPVAYVATNDYAVGQMVEAISHSPIWRSSAIFITEDDAQAGPDHVSDQRTTLFVVSPYASGGVHHEHYSTVGVIRTMELLLGLRPLSAYDAMAVPLYAAFSTVPRPAAYAAVPPKVGTSARGARTAYGAELSAKLGFRRPDANPPGALQEILARNHEAGAR